jgi:hypothetical protein
VRFPEEPGAVADVAALLQRASEGTKRFEVGKPAWMIDGQEKQLGFGMYF